MNKLLGFIVLVVCFLGLFLLINQFSGATLEEEQTNLEFFTPESENKFKKATEIREFVFPEDYSAHNEFLTEWWYYTGNLKTDEGRHFGYQLTFFRRAISGEENTNHPSAWNSNQIYLAHFAITDTQEGQHYVTDQIARNANNLSGTKVGPYFSIWLHDWEISQVADDVFLMQAKDDQIEIDFRLENLKNVVLHGENGLSQKGKGLGNASYYFSQTRLETDGKLRIENEWYEVSGLSWMDHEFGTSTLGEEQVGWDWFSIQLDNQSEIMLFQIRNDNGTISEYSSGAYVDSAGETQHLTNDDFTVQVTDTWKNPKGVEYPSGWRINIDQPEMDLELTPVIKNQEMDLFFQYWEGAVYIEGTINGVEVSGYGYVELTGYAQSMQGVF